MFRSDVFLPGLVLDREGHSMECWNVGPARFILAREALCQFAVQTFQWLSILNFVNFFDAYGKLQTKLGSGMSKTRARFANDIRTVDGEVQAADPETLL